MKFHKLVVVVAEMDLYIAYIPIQCRVEIGRIINFIHQIAIFARKWDCAQKARFDMCRACWFDGA